MRSLSLIHIYLLFGLDWKIGGVIMSLVCLLFIFGRSIYTVSYTHLDVYKRQGFVIVRQRRRDVLNVTIPTDGALADSITGAGDVYKRQVWHRS